MATFVINFLSSTDGPDQNNFSKISNQSIQTLWLGYKNKQTMEQGEIRRELAKEISALRVLASLVHGVLTLIVGI